MFNKIGRSCGAGSRAPMSKPVSWAFSRLLGTSPSAQPHANRRHLSPTKEPSTSSSGSSSIAAPIRATYRPTHANRPTHASPTPVKPLPTPRQVWLAHCRKRIEQNPTVQLDNPPNRHVYPSHISSFDHLSKMNLLHVFDNMHADNYVPPKDGKIIDLHQDLLVRVDPCAAYPPFRVDASMSVKDMRRLAPSEYWQHPCLARQPGGGVGGKGGRVHRTYLGDGTNLICKQSFEPCRPPPPDSDDDEWEGLLPVNVLREAVFYDRILMPLRLDSIPKYYGCFERLQGGRLAYAILLEDKGIAIRSFDDLQIEQKYRIYETLAYMHLQHGCQHYELLPSDIVIDPSSGQASLVGFSRARNSHFEPDLLDYVPVCKGGEEECFELWIVRELMGIRDYRSKGELKYVQKW